MALIGPARAEDPPRRVGSLNYISGEVAYALRGEAGEPGVSDTLSWSQADFNQPVCQDMSLRTGAMARARVRIGPDAIQMSSDTWLNMLNLSDQLIEASVRYGRVHLQLSKLDDGETVELEMPRGSLWLLQPGAYDIDIGGGAQDQPTRIVVFEGKARFVGGQADLPISAGEEVQVSGSYPAVVAAERSTAVANPAAPLSSSSAAKPIPAPPPPGPPEVALPPAAAPPDGAAPDRVAQGGEASSAPASPALSFTARPAADQPAATPSTPDTADGGSGSTAAQSSAAAAAGHAPSDDFLLWVEKSDDQAPTAPQSAQYVSPQTTGYDALDRYGRWDTLADGGPVWFPTSVPDDWAPYRFGHWASIPPWGWTWIDDQPWGFAPFHYGRWINIDGHWGWVPGAVAPHPVYAPALVAFIDTPDDSGGDPGNGPDGGPDVAWFPLGPGDDYAPWYPAGPDYVQSVNVAYWGHGRGVGAGERGREAWHGQYFNRRFATVVPRGVFADGRRVDREMMRVPADRLEHAAVMHGAPRGMMRAAAMRALAPPGELHDAPRGVMHAAAGPGGLRGEPGGGPAGEHAAGAGVRGGLEAGPGHGEGRPQQQFGRPEAGRNAAAVDRRGASQYGRSEFGRNAAQSYRGGEQQFARPQAFQNPAGGYRGAQQFGRPQAFQNPAGGYRGAQQFGRPQAFQNPVGGYRGAQQFGRPQAFQTPAAAYRGGGMMGRVAPQVAARPAAVRVGGGGGGRHK